MGALASTDVTVTIIDKDATRRGRRVNLCTVAFGDAQLTYPATGVPLPAKESFGMFQQILSLVVVKKPINGYLYTYDSTNHSLRIEGTHTHDVLVIGGVTADEDVGVLASGPTLGKLAATNRTLAGADSATKGGVVAGPLGEPPITHAPAATSLTVEVRGL
jgi:hypothetical protein